MRNFPLVLVPSTYRERKAAYVAVRLGGGFLAPLPCVVGLCSDDEDPFVMATPLIYQRAPGITTSSRCDRCFRAVCPICQRKHFCLGELEDDVAQASVVKSRLE